MVITSRRAEYGLIRSTLKEILEHPELELDLVVTGEHLMDKHGKTINQIKNDGFMINNIIKAYPRRDDGYSMAYALGECICELVKVVKKDKPDIILVLTDLGPALAGAIVGSHMNIPVAHIHGGDVSGTIDESIRHATTKFSHIHFAASKKSADRIKQLGEEEWRIFTVGAPGLDEILHEKLLPKKYLFKKFNLDEKKPLILVVQHPVTTEADKAGEQMRITLDALTEIDSQILILYPNSDSGSGDMIKIIERYSKKTNIHVFKNLERKIYLSFLKYSDVMVGNSSSGIIEAPSFKTPVVNIGSRQQGRERAENVIDVDHDKKEILSAVKKALYDDDFKEKIKRCKNPYGNGHAGEKIVEILSKIEINEKLLNKKFCDIP